MPRHRYNKNRLKLNSQFSNKDVLGFRIMGGLVCVVIIFGFITWMLQPKPYDKETFCLLNEPTNHYVMIVDLSDGLSPSQSQYILQLTRKIRDEMNKFDRLTVFSLQTSNNDILPLFDKCNPGSAKEANPIYQNPQAIKRAFDRFFEKPLEELIYGMGDQGIADSTPLLETLTRISQKYTSENNIEGTKFYIVSNFMQHSENEDGYSHYRYVSPPTYQDYANKPISRITNGRFAKADLNLIYLLDGRKSTNWVNSHIGFWVKWFQNANANIMFIEKII